MIKCVLCLEKKIYDIRYIRKQNIYLIFLLRINQLKHTIRMIIILENNL